MSKSAFPIKIFLKYHAPSSNVEAKGEEKRYRVIKKSTKSFNKNFDFRKVHLNRLNTEFKQQFSTFQKIHQGMYSRVHNSLSVVFFKILKKPSLVQK